MKDVQGIQRGKCNSPSCECEEYRTPPSDGPSRHRCEYCDHTPVEHVKIIKLGKCRKCGECEEYDSEDPNSYTECQYCGCDASVHEGAEKLRKPQATPGAQPGMMMQQQSMGFQPRTDAYGRPVQSTVYGTCKNPGCTFPKRVEGGKIYDFCSRTCGQQFQQLQAASKPPVPVMMTAVSGGPPPPAHPTTIAGTEVLITSLPSAMAPSGGQPVMTSTTAGVKLCKLCAKNPPNPGHAWCQQCFTSSKT